MTAAVTERPDIRTSLTTTPGVEAAHRRCIGSPVIRIRGLTPSGPRDRPELWAVNGRMLCRSAGVALGILLTLIGAGCSSSGRSAARRPATTTILASSLPASSTTSRRPPVAHESATGRDGTVFSFGDASFLGSTARRRLVAPVVAMAEAPDGDGYWLAAGDGG